MSRSAPAAALLLLLAAGCATGGDYPSLAPRAVEQLGFEEPIKVDPPVEPDPTLRSRADALLARARQGDAAFEEAYARALAGVRSAGASGSDSWIQAQELISRVEAARGPTTTALVEMDAFISERSDDPTNEAIWAEIIAAREAAEALAADQRRRLDQLKASAATP